MKTPEIHTQPKPKMALDILKEDKNEGLNSDRSLPVPTDRSQNNLSKLPYLNKIKKDNSPIGDTPQGSIKNKFPEFRFNSQQITNPDKKFQNLNFISPARPSLLTNLPEKNVPQYNLPMSQGNQGRESTSEPNQVDNFYDDLDQPDQQKQSDPFLTRQAIRMPSKVQL